MVCVSKFRGPKPWWSGESTSQSMPSPYSIYSSMAMQTLVPNQGCFLYKKGTFFTSVLDDYFAYATLTFCNFFKNRYFCPAFPPRISEAQHYSQPLTVSQRNKQKTYGRHFFFLPGHRDTNSPEKTYHVFFVERCWLKSRAWQFLSKAWSQAGPNHYEVNWRRWIQFVHGSWESQMGGWDSLGDLRWVEGSWVMILCFFCWKCGDSCGDGWLGKSAKRVQKGTFFVGNNWFDSGRVDFNPNFDWSQNPSRPHVLTLQGTNISPTNDSLKMIFLFRRWDMDSFPGGYKLGALKSTGCVWSWPTKKL